jgi:tetratricopeptide (TPR) repeat protein
MYGYPLWARTQRSQGSAAGGRQIDGSIYPSDYSPDGWLVLEAERLPPEATTAKSEWSGTSGAAILCEGLVIAVQSQHQNPNRPASLEASHLWKVYADEQWRHLLETHGISPSPALVQLPSSDQSRTTSTPPNNTPRKGSRNFIGREKELQQLNILLQQSEQVALVGMGGIGKTELALQYVRENQEKVYSGGVCWLEGRDRDIVTQVLTFAGVYLDLHPSEELSPDARIAYCWSKWPTFTNTESGDTDSVIVVIDDVTDYDSISPYLPNLPRFKLLFTTRLKHLATTVTPLNIDLLAKSNSLTLLKQLAGNDRVEADIEQANFLCQWLGYLPLALELVGLYLARKPSLTLAQLQVRLEEQELSARALTKSQPGMTTSLGVASAFELSWKDLETEIARRLAYSTSLFGISPIPWELIEPCFANIDPEDLEDIRDECLLNLHFLHHRGGDTYQLHQLVKGFLKSKSDEIDKSNRIKQSVSNNLALRSQEIPEDVTQEELYKFASIVPHIEEASQNLSNFINEAHFTHLFQGIGRYYEGQGLLDSAKKVYEFCVIKSQNRFGHNNFNTLKGNYELAAILYSQAKYDEAEILQNKILSNSVFTSKTISNPKQILFADTLNGLGLTLAAKGKYAEAMSFYNQSLAIRTELLGEKHLDVSDSFNNIALLHSKEGNYKNAETLLKKALNIRKEVLKEGHPRIASSLNNLASCYYEQNRIEEARELYSQALIVYRNLHKSKHRDIAKALNNLAQTYSNQGEHTQAEPLFLEALEIQKCVLGETHSDIAFSLNNIAALYEDLGRTQEAESFYREALKIRLEVLGKNHVNVAITMNNLAKLYQNNQRCLEAKPLYTEAVEILKANLRDDHPVLIRVKENLESVHKSLNKAEENL